MDHKLSSKAPLIFLIVLLTLLLLLAIFIARPFIEPVAIAIIVAVAFQSLHRWIQKRVKNPNQAALLTVMTLMVAVAAPLIAIVIAASGQAIGAAQFVSQKSAEQGGFVAFVMTILQKPLAFAGRYADLSNLESQITSRLQDAGAGLVRMGASILGNLIGLFGQLLLALFTAFFFFRDGDKYLDRITHMMPLTREQSIRLLSSIENAIVANFNAIVAVGGAQGALTTLALVIVGNRSPVLLGVIAAFCSLIPVVGPALVWGPLAIYLFFVGRTAAGIFLVLWGILAVGSIDNVIRPLVVRGKVEANTLLLLFAMLGGAQAFGLLGLFLGPILLSLITAVIATLAEVNEEAAATLGDPHGLV